jgi:hypothetical protein
MCASVISTFLNYFLCSAGVKVFGRARRGRDGPGEHRVSGISSAPPRQNLLDLFAM